MLSVIVSFGAPVNRNASPRSPSAETARGSSFRVMVSGLYWNTTTAPSGFSGSTPINAPFSNRGDPGNDDILRSPTLRCGFNFLVVERRARVRAREAFGRPAFAERTG